MCVKHMMTYILSYLPIQTYADVPAYLPAYLSTWIHDDTRCVHVTYTCVHVRARYVYTDTYVHVITSIYVYKICPTVIPMLILYIYIYT